MDDQDSQRTTAAASTTGWLAEVLGWLGRAEVAAGAWTAVGVLAAGSILRPELAPATRMAAVLAAVLALLSILSGQLDRLGGVRSSLPFFAEELAPPQRARLDRLRAGARRGAWLQRIVLAWAMLGLAGAMVWWKAPASPHGVLQLQPGQVVTSMTHTSAAGDQWRQLLDAELRVTRISQEDGVLVATMEAVRPGTEQAAAFTLRAGERARVHRERLTLAGSFASAAVRGASVAVSGPAGARYEGALRVGEPVQVGEHTLEMLDGSQERSGWLGGGIHIRERDAAGDVVREGWVPVDRAGWDARHGGGALGVDVWTLTPGQGVVVHVERVVSPVVAGTVASVWAGVLSLLLSWLMWGRIWVTGRDGDYEVAAASLVGGRAAGQVDRTIDGVLAAPQRAELAALRAKLAETPVVGES